MKKQVFLLDTDIGTDIDDALALFVLVQITKNDPIAVVTTNGPTKTRSQAALTLLDALKKHDIPVFEGISRSSANIPPFVHGKESDGVDNNHELQKLSELVRWVAHQDDQSINIITVAPATTTQWLTSQECIRLKFNKLFIMGGFIPEKGITKKEHNFSADPLAIKKILKMPLRIFAVPLNLTIQHFLTFSEINMLRNKKSNPGKLIGLWMNNWLNATEKFSGEDIVFRGKVFLHDPIVVVAALRPDLFSWKRIRFTVDKEGVVHLGGNREIFVCTKTKRDVISLIKQFLNKL